MSCLSCFVICGPAWSCLAPCRVMACSVLSCFGVSCCWGRKNHVCLCGSFPPCCVVLSSPALSYLLDSFGLGCLFVLCCLVLCWVLSCVRSLARFPFFRKDPDDAYSLTDETRSLGLVVCRGNGGVFNTLVLSCTDCDKHQLRLGIGIG